MNDNFAPAPALRARAGFTLLETMLALLLVGLLGLSLWGLGQAAGRKRLSVWRSADTHSALVTMDHALRTHVEGAGRGMLSTYNYGPLNVKRVRIGSVPFDTLIVLRADAPAVRNASRPCRSGANGCIVLFGDQGDHFARDDLVVTGSPATGARVLQVTAAPQVFTALCGADCMDEVFCRFTSDSGLGQPPAGSYTYVSGVTQGGPIVPGTCDQPYYPNGAQCREQWASRTFERQYPDCKPAGNPARFTELRVVDRTRDFGYPLGPPALLASATATPKIRTQKVGPVRFFVRGAGSARAELVRQTGLRRDGSWDRTVALAGPVTRFQVQTLHEAASVWAEGVGVTEAMLALGSGNRLPAMVPAPKAPPGYRYRIGYSTVAVSRVRYELRRTRNDGTPETVTRTVLLNSTPALGGGTDGGR